MFQQCYKKIRNQAKKSKWLTLLYRRYFMTLPIDANYTEVAEAQERLLSKLKVRTNSLAFSILVPVYKPDFLLFKEMVSSVLMQTYSNWQLILVDDASDDPELSVYFSELAASESRVKVVTSESNLHISAASNLGLAAVSGDYVMLLDHDDLLHKAALKTVAHYIEKHPDAVVLYSDEDKLTAKGERAAPHFKPKWNRDLLYAMNYISHLGVYKKSIIDAVGGFKLGVEGSQDYDLLLRCIEQCTDQQIVHIPFVLYHWRALRGSTALAESEKAYSSDAGLVALQEHLTTCTVEPGNLPNTYKVNWPVPESAPLVSIIIPTKNAKQLVKQCIDSIYKKTNYSHFEILLVDNQSDDVESLSYFSMLEQTGKVRLIPYDKPFNYSAINNYAVSKASGELLVLMNNDIEVMSDTWLMDMVANISRPEIGCVGAKLYYPNGRIQHAGVITGLGGVAGHSHKHFYKEDSGYFKRLQVTQNLSAVTAACLAVRKTVFEQVGGLNEQDLTIAFNDVDFCLKVQKAGYRNLWSPYIEMVHHESISRGAEDTPEKQARFANEISYMQKTWGKQLTNDPCYSQWLTLDREDFSLR